MVKESGENPKNEQRQVEKIIEDAKHQVDLTINQQAIDMLARLELFTVRLLMEHEGKTESEAYELAKEAQERDSKF